MAKPEHQATNPPYEYRSRQGSLGPITGSSLPRLCRLRCDSSRHEFSHRWSTQVSRTEFLISANRPFPSRTNHYHCVCARYATATSRPEQVLVRYQVASLPLGGKDAGTPTAPPSCARPPTLPRGSRGSASPSVTSDAARTDIISVLLRNPRSSLGPVGSAVHCRARNSSPVQGFLSWVVCRRQAFLLPRTPDRSPGSICARCERPTSAQSHGYRRNAGEASSSWRIRPSREDGHCLLPLFPPSKTGSWALGNLEPTGWVRHALSF